MKVIIAKAAWGMTESVEGQLEKIAEAGYTAYESPVPAGFSPDALHNLLEQYGLQYIAQMHTDGVADADEHIATFRERYERALSYGPLKVNSHTGRDSMEWDAQRKLFVAALEAEAKGGVRVVHETHRSRCTFTPWTTAKLLREFPEMAITADFSHWVNVTESFLSRYEADVAYALGRAEHIHGRVGAFHTPQVSDPRAPEVETELNTHEAWWHEIYARRKASGAEVFTFTPEFGPPGYMPVLPYTRQPISNLWDVNNWIHQRFAAWAQAQ